YYGDWLPNTYYAKVGGRTWWDMGSKYLAMYSLEYALWLWLPLVVVAKWRGLGRATVIIPAAVILIVAIYVAAIGGDHFEYRPLGLVAPLLCLLVFGASIELRASKVAGAWLVLILAGSFVV